MEKKSKKSLIIGVTSLFLVTFILLGLTYAYYRTRIIGNNSNVPSVSVTSKNMEITLEYTSYVVYNKFESKGIHRNQKAFFQSTLFDTIYMSQMLGRDDDG